MKRTCRGLRKSENVQFENLDCFFQVLFVYQIIAFLALITFSSGWSIGPAPKSRLTIRFGCAAGCAATLCRAVQIDREKGRTLRSGFAPHCLFGQRPNHGPSPELA